MVTRLHQLQTPLTESVLPHLPGLVAGWNPAEKTTLIAGDNGAIGEYDPEQDATLVVETTGSVLVVKQRERCSRNWTRFCRE